MLNDDKNSITIRLRGDRTHDLPFQKGALCQYASGPMLRRGFFANKNNVKYRIKLKHMLPVGIEPRLRVRKSCTYTTEPPPLISQKNV